MMSGFLTKMRVFFFFLLFLNVAFQKFKMSVSRDIFLLFFLSGIAYFLYVR